MRFYKHLYVGEGIKQVDKVKRKLKRGAGQFSVYVIALSMTEDQLDIFHCAHLKQKYFDRDNLFIVGLAGGYYEAVDLVVKMAQQVVDETGDADIKGYIRERI